MIKIVIEYQEYAADRNPWYAEVHITTPVTDDLEKCLQEVKGVETISKSFNRRYELHFVCGQAFNKQDVANNVRMAITEFFDK